MRLRSADRTPRTARRHCSTPTNDEKDDMGLTPDLKALAASGMAILRGGAGEVGTLGAIGHDLPSMERAPIDLYRGMRVSATADNPATGPSGWIIWSLKGAPTAPVGVTLADSGAAGTVVPRFLTLDHG